MITLGTYTFILMLIKTIRNLKALEINIDGVEDSAAELMRVIYF